MHLIPQLRKLEQKYASELVVIGVHSAKFPNEQATEQLHQAVRRYDIAHPVVNDAEFQLWQQYAARAWPTLYFIDPLGRVIGRHEGEIAFEPFDRLISAIVSEFEAEGLIDRRPIPELTGLAEAEHRVLWFPGKVAADAAGERLVIADTNHDRLLIASPAGEVLDIVGSGIADLADGSLSTARFNRPQGVAIRGDVIYVADTGNHVVRKVDLAARSVETIAGTGAQARRLSAGGRATEIGLNSPWDLALVGNTLYIAMAGFHQIWALGLNRLMIRPHAGAGGENLVDGPLATALFAQPSGITTDGDRLYVADSESSALRQLDSGSEGKVRTIFGQGLFEFGDVDGIGDVVRLQHPLGVVWHSGVLYVADTYNHKIKRVDPRSRTAATLAGTGRPGFQDGAADHATFNEPSGLAAIDGRLYIADTNNHAIRVLDLERQEVSTLELHTK